MPFAEYAALTAQLRRYDRWSQEQRIF